MRPLVLQKAQSAKYQLTVAKTEARLKLSPFGSTEEQDYITKLALSVVPQVSEDSGTLRGQFLRFPGQRWSLDLDTGSGKTTLRFYESDAEDGTMKIQ